MYIVIGLPFNLEIKYIFLKILFGISDTQINSFECSRPFKSLYIHLFIIISINHRNFFARFAVTKDLTGGNNLTLKILSSE